MCEKMDGLSMDLEKTNMEKLKAVFPECFAEGKLDIDKLLSLCGEYIDNDFEKYKFEWKGKSECLRLAQKRSTGTLRPCREESVNFDDTQNVYIEGDNLEVLKLLQTAYYNKVKMIYIDPPYNTGNDFVYEDDFADPMARYKEITEQTTKSNPETMGRFHTNWLNMMYPRLRLAANLLTDDGVIFISIDDNEVHNLRKICDETFGEENFVAQIVWQKIHSIKNDAKYFSVNHDYIIIYAKAIDNFSVKLLPRTEEMNSRYKNPDHDPRGAWQSGDLVANGERSTGYYDVISPKTGKVFNVEKGKHWVYSQDNMQELIANNEIWFGLDGNSFPRKKRFLADVQDGRTPNTIWLSDEAGHNQTAARELKQLFDDKKYFDYPKPVELMKMLLQVSTNEKDIILDFFSGSATTAHAVMQLNAEDGGNRKFICVQLPELCDEKSEAYKAGYKNICEIGKERIRRAGQKIQDTFAKMTIKMQDRELSNEEKPVKLMFNTVISKEPNISVQEFHTDNLDIGFKVFKLDTSNLKIWDNTPIADTQIDLFYKRMNDMIDSIKDDRTNMDVVYEVMLKMGVPLDIPVTYTEINDKIAYVVGDMLLLICLSDNITAEDIEKMADFAPAKIVCAEQGFADDSALSNAHYILKDKEIELKLV